MTQDNPFNKISPKDYLESAIIAHTAGAELLSRLALTAIQPRTIVDVGCGIGDLTEQLHARYPHASIIALDSATHFLDYAATHYAHAPIQWKAHDLKTIPLNDQSVDLIIANMFLPWCHELKTFFSECHRILRPEGLFVFTTLGPDTLRNIPDAFLTPMHLTDMHHLGDALVQTGFLDPIMDMDTFTLKYRESTKLLHELTAMGLIADPPTQSPLSLLATFEIIHGHTWGSQPIKTAKMDETGTVTIPLSYLRK